MKSISIYICQTVLDMLPPIVFPADARERARGLERELKGIEATLEEARVVVLGRKHRG